MHKQKELKFQAELEGGNEVPPVDTEAEGNARLIISPDQRTLQVTVVVEEIRRVVQAHIHLGEPGENGPIVAFLFGPSDPVSFEEEALLACRTVTRGDLVGPLQGQPLSALIEEIRDGNAYVNVHTVQNPGGEIRGQLKPC